MEKGVVLIYVLKLILLQLFCCFLFDLVIFGHQHVKLPVHLVDPHEVVVHGLLLFTNGDKVNALNLLEEGYPKAGQAGEVRSLDKFLD